MPKTTAIARKQNLFITSLLFWGKGLEPKMAHETGLLTGAKHALGFTQS
jgi:hypothetical protein